MTLTSVGADIVDRMNPDSQRVGLGAVVRSQGDRLVNNTPVTINFAVTADLTAGVTIPVGFGIEVLDVIVQARVTQAGGTVRLFRAATPITDAIVMATNQAITRVGTIDAAQSTVLATEALRIVTVQPAARGLVTIIARPV